MIRNYTIGELKAKFAQLHYPWPTDPYHLIGIRSSIKGDNQFNDLLIFVEQLPNRFANLTYGVGTTIPGKYYLLNLLNPKGAAILKEGQWRNSWKVGLHNGYKAFIQCAPITVYRDKNKNLLPEEIVGTEDTGYFGIDIHRAGKNFIAKLIDNFSAGCQVWDDPEIFAKTILTAEQSGQKAFTYTLLNEF